MFYDDDVSCSGCNLVFISIHSFWYHGRSVYLTQTSHIYGLVWFSEGSFLLVSVEESVVSHFSFVHLFEKYWTSCSNVSVLSGCTELRVLVLGQTLNHWVVCSGWALNRWVVRSGVVRSVSHVLTRLIHSVSHDSSRLVWLSSGFLVAAI